MLCSIFTLLDSVRLILSEIGKVKVKNMDLDHVVVAENNNNAPPAAVHHQEGHVVNCPDAASARFIQV